MVYDDGKEYLVEARLMPLARSAGFAELDDYITHLTVDAAERIKALDALTINETSWFRDQAPYRAFTDVMLPALLEARATSRTITIWSAACSSGQEAYSLAMLLHEHLPDGWSAKILATDVSPSMVQRVRDGRYSQVEVNRGLPAAMLVQHFTRVGTEWKIAPHLCEMVEARELNLAQPFPFMPRCDVVFLRNVLIYFDVETKREILRRVHDVMAPDGYLLLGSSETTIDLDTHWTRETAGRTQLHRPVPKHALTGA